MNALNKRLQEFLDHNPEYKGEFIGYKKSRGGLGISRIDDDWFECDDYFISFDSLTKVLGKRRIKMTDLKKEFEEKFCKINLKPETGSGNAQYLRYQGLGWKNNVSPNPEDVWSWFSSKLAEERRKAFNKAIEICSQRIRRDNKDYWVNGLYREEVVNETLRIKKLLESERDK